MASGWEKETKTEDELGNACMVETNLKLSSLNSPSTSSAYAARSKSISVNFFKDENDRVTTEPEYIQQKDYQ